jgi:predicted tellurium resistance membrane protein TerC
MLELLTDPQAWIAFLTLTLLELVLGIDNIVLISILVDKLPRAQQERARRIGLFMAMFMRIGLLLVLSWIVGLTAPLFTVMAQEISGRDLILIGGGLFLIWKSTGEIHHDGQTSMFPARSALASMKSRRGSTSSPISIVNTRSASIASSICTRSRRRTPGSIVVSHSCIGFISPRPL